MSIFDIAGKVGTAGSMMAGSSMMGGLGSAMMGPPGLLLAGGLAGLNAFSSMNQAEEEVDILGNQISSLKGAQSSLDESYGQKKGLATDKYSEQLEQLSYGAGQSLYDISTQGSQAAGRTGMARSGTVETNIERARGTVRDKFGFEQTGLESMLGESLMNIEEWYGAQSSDLSTQMEGLKYQKEQAQSRTGLGGFVKSFLGA